MLKECPLILIIEDESDIRENVTLMLQAEGYSVAEASSVTDGLQKAFNLLPTLIICDVMLKQEHQGGWTILNRIRLDERLRETPFIFITARADRSDVRHAMEIGADDYLTKPFTRDELLGSVFAQLKKRKNRPELIDRTYLLVVHEPGQVPYRFNLSDSCLIGRSNKCDLVFKYKFISSMHCAIEKDREKGTGNNITDGDITAPSHTPSSNGTFIQRQKDIFRVQVRVPLMAGDRIFLLPPNTEQSIRLDYIIEGEPESEGTLS